MKNIQRCDWSKNEVLNKYHDNEWCQINHNDNFIFEMLILENMQAGLNWLTILLKREHYRKALDNFNYQKIAKYNENKFNELLENECLIRNKLKIKAIINNAQKFIEIQNEFGSFNSYIWSFVNNEQVQNKWITISEIPAQTELSVIISNNLKKRGFKFVGPVIVYSFLQAIGIIDDHISICFKYEK
ncbi:DNA-3-methyladenine glycosylase I [Mesoplasma chauliocola]|uniref:DNA-3-methyladenine glycosylase I n=1 Tax=Mesoplasma chauliocola TaxID=216427 RepID=A0A249SN59_9MOLU|nr:DNA-3-methyladenine glycosylase I [Mesoplasma chauliocola]ASZ09033.1 DNA-3-methyladenine glycosylase I [Mesoplasma chauliocola]